MARINWRQDIQPYVDTALRYFQGEGVRPTLRTLFYNLVSQNIIGNTKSTYKGLSKWLVQARKDGLVAWNALEDNARNVYGTFSDSRFHDDLLDNNKERLDEKLGEFNAENLIAEFFDYVANRAFVGRWSDQPNVAELWIEKEALAKTVQAWTERYDVKIRVNKGYSSWTFIYENARELKEYLDNEYHEKVVIFYLGDMDPSGVDMERFLKEALEYFGLDSSRVKLQRLSVTDAQIEKYNLPPRPDDAETIAKLKRDSRTANYTGQYIVELDAMVAFVPQEFRKLIIEAIKGVWDEEIYEKLREQAREINEKTDEAIEDIKEKARELMRDL